MKNKKTIIGFVIAIILILVLCHPAWLPISQASREALSQSLADNFRISTGEGVNTASLLSVLLMVCILWLVCSVLTVILNAVKTKRSHTKTVLTLTLSVIKYAGVLIGIIWGLKILGVNVSTILASLGIISLIIGFGAQSLIEDIITGIFIIFEGHYNIGDVIVLGDFRGTVRDITVRTTVIEDLGGNLKVVNNSDIRNFQNRSKKNSLAICDVSVTYKTDIRALEELLKKELPKMYEPNKEVFLAAPKYMGVEELGDNGVVLHFIADCREENIYLATRALNREIKLLFDDNGIEIPFPQVVVHKGE